MSKWTSNQSNYLMVQSNSSERVQKNNGNYAEFPVPSMWYKKGVSSDYVISVERV